MKRKKHSPVCYLKEIDVKIGISIFNWQFFLGKLFLWDGDGLGEGGGAFKKKIWMLEVKVSFLKILLESNHKKKKILPFKLIKIIGFQFFHSKQGMIDIYLLIWLTWYVYMYRNKAVATRPFDIGPSNFHTMTSLGSDEAFWKKFWKTFQISKWPPFFGQKWRKMKKIQYRVFYFM